MKQKKEKSVIVSLWSAGSCGRKQLAGILRYVNAGHPWNVRIIMDPKEFDEELIHQAERDGVDGFIAFTLPSAAKALAASRIPTVLLSFPQPALMKRRKSIAFFLNDNEEIGRMGADYFLSLGTFFSYGFVPDASGRGWSRLRERGYRERLRAAGKECIVYSPRAGSLSEWLKELPKPAAVMAPFDFLSREIVEACRRAKISVPQQVSVLGVDDDELICDTCRPSLSSIRLDQDLIGYRAAECLNRMMTARNPKPAERVMLPNGRVIERASTKYTSPVVHLVKAITSYIDAHATEGVTVDDVARGLGISRRLADLRLREATGKTVRQAIEDRRLDEVKRHLETSQLPICKITKLCGYENGLWVKYVFKRRFGMTMTDFRRMSSARASRKSSSAVGGRPSGR